MTHESSDEENHWGPPAEDYDERYDWWQDQFHVWQTQNWSSVPSEENPRSFPPCKGVYMRAFYTPEGEDLKNERPQREQ